MSVTIHSKTLLSATLLWLNEPEESEKLVIEEGVEMTLERLVYKIVNNVEESYRNSPPKSGLEAVAKAEEALLEVLDLDTLIIDYLIDYRKAIRQFRC